MFYLILIDLRPVHVYLSMSYKKARKKSMH